MQVEGELQYVYKRTRQVDRYVVPFTPLLLLIWHAHVNVQYATSAGLSKYVTKYVTKVEPRSIVNIQNEPDRLTRHLDACRIGAMEIMCLLNSKQILKLSSAVLFLPNAPPYIRTYTIRRVADLEVDPDSPYYSDAMEKYFERPSHPIFNGLTYPEYFRNFSVERKRRRRIADTQREEWIDETGKNYVYRRSKAMLTRSPFRRLADGESFFYALLLEKGSWRREEELLLGVDTYRERFMTLYPDEYGEVIAMEQVAEYTTQLHHVNLYNEIVETIIEEFGREDMSLRNLIETQFESLKRLSMRANTLEDYNPVLHMDHNQYNCKGLALTT